MLIRIYKISYALVLIISGHTIGAEAASASNTDANRLYEDLMMSYNRFVRPVQNDSDTLIVKLGLKLSQLIDVVSIDWLIILIILNIISTAHISR